LFDAETNGGSWERQGPTLNSPVIEIRQIDSEMKHKMINQADKHDYAFISYIGSENALKISGSFLGLYMNYTKLPLFQDQPGAGSEMKPIN
jgi:hypothetical protein